MVGTFNQIKIIMKPNYKVLLLLLLIPFAACKKEDPSDNKCIDAEGYEYNTVKIGNQVWMAENLRTTKFRNGEDIPNIKGDTSWVTTTTPAYCMFNNDPAQGDVFGLMYNKYVLTDKRNIAPKGWHVPSKEEFKTLINYLGKDSVVSKIKEPGTLHWYYSSPVSNESGFTALGAGYRTSMYNFNRFASYLGFHSETYFWSKTIEINSSDAPGEVGFYMLGIVNIWKTENSRVFIDAWHPGAYIRCIKD